MSFLIVMLVVVIILAALAESIGVAYPIVMLAGGIGMAMIPQVPYVSIDPDLALVIFLAPVLFQSAYTISWRDLRANMVPVMMLALGAVFVTMFAVGGTSQFIFTGMPLAVALTLGAIVSPPDAVAATAVFSRVGVPRRMNTIIEGESLVNDASALIAYQFAVAAVVTGQFSLKEASLQFVFLGVGSVLFGLACGWLLTHLVPLLPTAELSAAITLIAAPALYVLADRIELSGVLVVVTSGMYFGHHSYQALSPEARLTGKRAWQTALIVLNGLVFLLIGLEFAEIVYGFPMQSVAKLVWQSVVISLVVVAVRFAWVLGSSAVYRLFAHESDDARKALSWRVSIAISWSGLRGIVSVASALALPVVIADGDAFPWREDIIFVVFVVIVVTLVGQGLTLPWLLRTLQIEPGRQGEREIWIARRRAVEAALASIDGLEDAPWANANDLDFLRWRYRHLLQLTSEDGNVPDESREHLDALRRVQQIARDAARKAILSARDKGEIGNDARLAVEAELDREDERVML